LRLFNKFYSEGIRRAGILGREKNLQGMQRFNNENTNLILKISNILTARGLGSQKPFRHP
jgi:hypothetical protein